MQKPVYIVGGTRTPFGKSMTVYADVTAQDLMTATLAQLTKQFNLQNQRVGDIGIGAVMHNSMDWDFARECMLGAGLSPYTPGYSVQRACASSLETTWQLALKIAAGEMNTAISGGVDTNSDIPVTLPRSFTRKLLAVHSAKGMAKKVQGLLAFRPVDFKFQIPSVKEPRTGMSMGEHCEKMVQEWGISREDQDALALASHQHAAAAYSNGFFSDLIFPFHNVAKDTFVRADTTLQKMAQLKPAFDFSGKGTLTAGNSSPLSDGASATLLASEEGLRHHNFTPLARFVDAEVAAVDFVQGDGLLMAPTIAVSRLLERNQLTLQDFDYYEIHEAFAGQVLCTLKAWESAAYCLKFMGRPPLGAIDRQRLNVNGSSIAIGHPFAATGARIVASLAKMLHQSDKKRGLISICTAGGMGCAAILERV